MLPAFEAILGQDAAIRKLRSVLKNRRIPHALLFTGMDGVGKRTTAVMMARACNCLSCVQEAHGEGGAADETPASSGYPCGTCRFCVKIAEGMHPDVTIVEPENGTIKISQIRSLCDVLMLRPFECRMRVAIISDAHLMNPSAGNALLKTLEEPPAHTLLILTAHQTTDLLPTIVSRCQHIRFNPVSRAVLSDILMRQRGLGAEEASIISRLAGGSVSKAIGLKASWMHQRCWLMDELSRLHDSSLHIVLALSEKLSKNRDALPDVFEIMLSWFRDILVFSHDPDRVINQDALDGIREASGRYDSDQVYRSIRAVQMIQNHIQAKANVQLSLDHLLLSLKAFQQ